MSTQVPPPTGSPLSVEPPASAANQVGTPEPTMPPMSATTQTGLPHPASPSVAEAPAVPWTASPQPITSSAAEVPNAAAKKTTTPAKVTPPVKKSSPLPNLTLIGFFLKKHRILLIVIALCVAAYSLMIIALWPMFIDEDFLRSMEELAAAMPGLETEAFSMTLGEYMESQWLGVYWLPLAGAVMIVLASKAIGGSVADGTLETIFSGPLKRSSYLNSLLVALFIMAGILSLATVLPLTFLGPLFEAEIDISTTLLLIVATWLILFVFGLIVMALSAWSRGIALSASVAVAIILVMLVLYMATPSVEFLEILEPINLLHWWGSAQIFDSGEVEAGLWIWLAVVGVASIVLAYLRFLRRDLA